MLELRDLVKHYPNGDGEPVRAVDGACLQVQAGEMVALYGPSGSGKTTLLNLIAALLRPDGGAVIVDGRDISTLSDGEASHYRLHDLGYVEQSMDLLPGGNVIQNASLKLWIAVGVPEGKRRIEPLLVRLGLQGRLKHRAEHLSMGERQRVSIARALSINPRSPPAKRSSKWARTTVMGVWGGIVGPHVGQRVCLHRQQDAQG